MSSGAGIPDSIPNRYVGPNADTVPITVFPREPLGTDRKYPIGQMVLIGKNPSSGTQGDLWYLAKIVSNVADWRILAASGGSVTDLRDQLDNLVTPTNDGYIDIDGAVVANGATPSGIPLESVGTTNTLTLQLQVATALGSAPADKNDAGICSFDSTAFSVSSNGFVTLAGGAGPAVDSVNVEFSTAPGTDPVVATGAGVITVSGATVANATNASAPVATHSRAANAFNIEVQVAADRTGAPANKFDAGLSSYNDTQFVVDTNGYTSLVGGANLPAIQTLTSDDPTAVGPDGSGNVTITGEAVANATNAKPLFVDAGANSLNLEIQVATERTGAPANKLDAGICSFDDTAFSVDANGYVTLAGGAGPAIDNIEVDFNTAPGTDPVGPTGAGLITFAGSTVANGTNTAAPVATHSRAANALNIEVQVATERTGAPANKNDAGLCSFDDTAFAVDANGYVTLTGGAGISSINVQTKTSTGAFTYTPTSGMAYVIVELQGGGGGSGGTAATAGTIALAQGGSAGAYAKFLLTAAQVGASLTGSVGAGGAGGAAGNNAGSNGGDTTLATAAAWTAAGGDGGNGGASAASATVNAVGGGAVTTGTGTVILNISGGDSGNGAAAAATVLMGSSGGDAFLGAGGKSIYEAVASNSSAGIQGVGYGAGAAGAVSYGTTIAQAGGAGKDGIAVFTEFI